MTSDRGRGIVLTPGGQAVVAAPPTTALAPPPPSRLPPHAASFLHGQAVPTVPASAAGVAARARTPLKITACPLAARLAPRTALPALAASGCNAPCTLTLGRPCGEPTLLPWNGGANGAESPFRVRAPPTRVAAATLAAAAAKAAAWTRVASLVRCALVRGGGGASETTPLDAAATLDWPWLAAFAAAARLPAPRGVDLVAAGARGAVLAAAAGEADALVAATHGTHRVLLAPPAEFTAAGYPFAAAHPAAGASMVDWAHPDLGAWPAFAGLKCWHATLHPGEALFVPALWAAHWEMPPDGPRPAAAVTVTFGWRPPSDRGALTAAAARAAEARLAAALPPAGVRAALAAIGRGGDVRGWLAAAVGGVGGDNGGAWSVDTLAVADALDAAAAALEAAAGRPNIQKLTRALTSRRLRPTPWLETAGVDDDAARDVPRRFVDDRTDEERRFPTLFRRSVEAKLAARRPWGAGAVEGAGKRLLQQ